MQSDKGCHVICPKKALLARTMAYVQGTQLVKCTCTRNEKLRILQFGENLYVYVVFLFLIIKAFKGVTGIMGKRLIWNLGAEVPRKPHRGQGLTASGQVRGPWGPH